jgi:hypothetical protein
MSLRAPTLTNIDQLHRSWVTLAFLLRSPSSTTEPLHQLTTPLLGLTLGTRVSGELLDAAPHHLAEAPALLLTPPGQGASSFARLSI